MLVALLTCHSPPPSPSAPHIAILGAVSVCRNVFGPACAESVTNPTLLGARCGRVCTTFIALLYLTWWPPVEPGKAGRDWVQQTSG